MSAPANSPKSSRFKLRWLNRTVLGIGLASLFADWSHEIATSVMPVFLGTMGLAGAWLGLIEGVSDGLSSLTKLGSGYYTDKLRRRKPIAVIGYVVTALGTASFGLASNAWHVLAARSLAWFGRGARTPVRKALLAAAVTKETYGRAFGFERMMDTFGAILGPATAMLLLWLFPHQYRTLFAFTLIPGLIAAAVIMFIVKEKGRTPVPHISLTERLRLLPKPYGEFLVAVGLFGAGDFSHALLIMLATQRLTPSLGAANAVVVTLGLYTLQNIFYAAFAYISGWLADHFKKTHILAAGYGLAALMAVLIIVLPPAIWSFTIIFILGGVYMAIEETVEDSLCAELVGEDHHGMAFGALATVNGVGDCLSSVIVGVLWSHISLVAGFGYSAILFAVGALLVLQIKPEEKSEVVGSQ